MTLITRIAAFLLISFSSLAWAQTESIRTKAGASWTSTQAIRSVKSVRISPNLTYPILVETTAPNLRLVIPPATPPGTYTVEIDGTDPTGRPLARTLEVTVDAITIPRSAGALTPVVLLNGFQLSCTSKESTLAASTETFGQLGAILQADGAPVTFFNNCVYGEISIENLATQLRLYLGSLRYTDGSPIAEFDLVAHSMGGLIVRAYLAGKGTNPGDFDPPANPQIRKLITLATPHFGSFLALDSGAQLSELVLGSRFLFDLATWNQGQDDLRGVDTLALIGNAGTNNLSDGVVTLTSGSLNFARPEM